MILRSASLNAALFWLSTTSRRDESTCAHASRAQADHGHVAQHKQISASNGPCPTSSAVVDTLLTLLLALQRHKRQDSPAHRCPQLCSAVSVASACRLCAVGRCSRFVAIAPAHRSSCSRARQGAQLPHMVPNLGFSNTHLQHFCPHLLPNQEGGVPWWTHPQDLRVHMRERHKACGHSTLSRMHVTQCRQVAQLSIHPSLLQCLPFSLPVSRLAPHGRIFP